MHSTAPPTISYCPRCGYYPHRATTTLFGTEAICLGCNTINRRTP